MLTFFYVNVKFAAKCELGDNWAGDAIRMGIHLWTVWRVCIKVKNAYQINNLCYFTTCPFLLWNLIIQLCINWRNCSKNCCCKLNTIPLLTFICRNKKNFGPKRGNIDNKMRQLVALVPLFFSCVPKNTRLYLGSLLPPTSWWNPTIIDTPSLEPLCLQRPAFDAGETQPYSRIESVSEISRHLMWVLRISLRHRESARSYFSWVLVLHQIALKQNWMLIWVTE